MADTGEIPTDYRAAEDYGKRNRSTYSQELEICSDNFEKLAHERGYEAKMRGTIRWPSLSTNPLTVEDGRLTLFKDDPDQAGLVHMHYQMILTGTGGPYYFDGIKNLHSRPTDILHVWSQTTTLYVTVYSGESSHPDNVLARGIIKVSFRGLVQQLLSMRSANATSWLMNRKVALRFQIAFVEELCRIYLGLGASRRFNERD